MPTCLTPDRPLGVAKTWEVRCASCGDLKYPLRVTAPGEPYTCQLCLLAGPETVAARQAAHTRAARAQRLRNTSAVPDHTNEAPHARPAPEKGPLALHGP